MLGYGCKTKNGLSLEEEVLCEQKAEKARMIN